MTEIQQHLFSLQDKEYKKNHAKRMSSISEENITGIRVPLLRQCVNALYRNSSCHGKDEYSVQTETFIKRLDPWTHNKTIQKAVESYKTGDELKPALKSMKITGKAYV